MRKVGLLVCVLNRELQRSSDGRFIVNGINVTRNTNEYFNKISPNFTKSYRESWLRLISAMGFSQVSSFGFQVRWEAPLAVYLKCKHARYPDMNFKIFGVRDKGKGCL